MIKQIAWRIGWVVVLNLVFCFSSHHAAAAHANTKTLLSTLDSRISHARESFEEIYYELVKQGFFDTYYNNNLIINTKIDEKIAQEGEIFLYLIDWLNKREDRDSYYLLKKLSKYLYLEFYRIICKVDAQKNQNSTLLHMLKDIYKSKIVTPYGTRAPFRAILSKMILLIFMINATQQSYDKKREAMAYTLHKIEDELFAINASLFEKPITDDLIKNFIQTLQTHITKEPLVKPSIVKRVVITIIIVGAIIALVFVVYQNSGSIKDWFSNLAKQLEDGFKTIGKGMAEGMVTEIKNQKLGEQFGRDFIAGMARDNGGQPNPDSSLLAQNLGRGIVNGLARENHDGQPNPDTDLLAQRIGNGIVRGMARDSGGQANPDTDLLAERIGNRMIHGLAREGNGQPNPDTDLLAQRLGSELRAGVIGGHPIDATGRLMGYIGRGVSGFCRAVRHPINTYHRVRGNQAPPTPPSATTAPSSAPAAPVTPGTSH